MSEEKNEVLLVKQSFQLRIWNQVFSSDMAQNLIFNIVV